MTKASDAELYRCAQVEAAKRGAVFVGPAPTYKYGVFRIDGREVEIHLYHVRKGAWPKDIDQFIARQTTTRGRNRDKMLTKLLELAEAGNARLQDEQWEGPHYWYSFAIEDGRVVKIRGSKLITTGWPEDIDAYLEWSAARRQGDSEPRSKAELFREFKTAVARNNAVVLNTDWLGARMPHDVLLSDGTVRSIKPNQLKYFGWPLVPLDELRKLAGAFPVHILPDTANQKTQVFRIVVTCGVYMEGSFSELKEQWERGAAGHIAEAARWAEELGLRMAPARWSGIFAEYEFMDRSGQSQRRMLPAASAAELCRRNDLELAKLRRIGTMHGAKLLSVTFAGKDVSYQWDRAGEVVQATAKELIDATRARAKFDTLKAKVADLGLGATLVSTEWSGMCAAYRWRLADGHELSARFSQLRLLARNCGAGATPAPASAVVTQVHSETGKVALAAVTRCGAPGSMCDWADAAGIKLLSTNWEAQGADYEWVLPDGTVVAASLKKVRNCTRAVMRQREFVEQEASVPQPWLTKAECLNLAERISTSRSR